MTILAERDLANMILKCPVKRVKRGLYQTKDGYRFNADCNGALNILRKSSVVDISVLYGRGELDTPKRIRIA